MILPGWMLFAAPVDGARLHQVQQAVRKHLGMHAKVFPIGQGAERGVGDAADAQLQRRAVLDQLGDVLADALLDLRWRCDMASNSGRSTSTATSIDSAV